MSRSCRFAGRPASAHVNTNPGSDLRRLPRKYDVKITSQSQTGLRRAATHRAEVQRACPGASFITATSTAGGRASVEFGVSTRRQSDIWAQAATRMRYANEVVPIVRLSPDIRSVRMPYILLANKSLMWRLTERAPPV